MKDFQRLGRGLAIAALGVGAAALASPAIADDAVSYSDCFGEAAADITLNIIKQCRADSDRNSANTGSTDATRVNLILQEGRTSWTDPRGPLSQKAHELGLSVEEVHRIRKATGVVVCPAYNSGGSERVVASGMLVGNSDLIVTAASVFIDPATNKRREPLSDCRFVNQADPPEAARLDFSSEKSYKFYTVIPRTAWYNDRAIVRLAHRISGAVPLPFDLDEAPLRRGDRLIMVSADQERMTVPMTKGHLTLHDHEWSLLYDMNPEPIAQACTTMAYYSRTAVASSVLYSDCNATGTSYGSIVLIRKQDGSLLAKALLTQTGASAADYKPFKVGSGVPPEDLSFALSIGLDVNVYSDVEFMDNAK